MTPWNKPIRQNKIGIPSIENYQLRCLFVHNLGIEDTAANGARCSTLARPVRVGLVYTLLQFFCAELFKALTCPYVQCKSPVKLNALMHVEG